jgi:hypothetical protein
MTVAFGDHVALLRAFLDRRQAIVESIAAGPLNARAANLQGAFDACFFQSAGLPREYARLHGQLAAAHLADGFEPIPFEGHSHELDPIQLVVRAHQQWSRDRWPGRNIRQTYAATLYAVYILRQLEYLSLRVWDEGNEPAADRLQEVQRLLDDLNEAVTGATSLVRDARWLIQSAQGTLTRRLQPYFTVAERIAGSFSDAGRLEIHKAGVKLTAGHLRSQLRYRALETRRPAGDPGVLATTRNSNSMDAALLLRDLVPLLDAYRTACGANDGRARLDLADAILQGLSADPELLLTRLDLLGPCTMIEDLFIERDDHGRAGYTPLGEAHVRRLERYGRLIGDLAGSLEQDARALDPSRLAYSPFGIAYGFCADLLSNLASGPLRGQPDLHVSLEDFFVSHAGLEARSARAACVEYSPEWADEVFAGVVRALHARAARRFEANASDLAGGRLFVVPEPGDGEPQAGPVPLDGVVLAQEHCVTSDLQRALGSGATAFPRGQIVADRNEARFLASAETGGKWFGVSKVVLTVCTSQGKDALITGVPAPVVDVLRLTCPGLLSIQPQRADVQSPSSASGSIPSS